MLPNLAIGGLDGTGIPHRVANRRACHAVSQSGAQRCKFTEVTGLDDRKPYVGVFINSDKLAQTERRQTRGCQSRGNRVARQRYDRKPHPQRVERRHASAVGKWVESDVDLLIGDKMIEPFTLAEERQPLRRDTLLGEDSLDT